MRCQSLTNRPL